MSLCKGNKKGPNCWIIDKCRCHAMTVFGLGRHIKNLYLFCPLQDTNKKCQSEKRMKANKRASWNSKYKQSGSSEQDPLLNKWNTTEKNRFLLSKPSLSASVRSILYDMIRAVFVDLELKETKRGPCLDTLGLFSWIKASRMSMSQPYSAKYILCLNPK